LKSVRFLFSTGAAAALTWLFGTSRVPGLAAIDWFLLAVAYQAAQNVETTFLPLARDEPKSGMDGMLTLPLIYLLEQASPEERMMVRTVLEEGDFLTVSRDEILALVRRHRTLERTRDLAASYALKARQALDLFPSSPARDGLLFLPQFVVSRQY